MERVAADQLQSLLGDTESLDPIQLRFRPCHRTKAVLVALLNELIREADQGSVNLLALLNLSAAFDPINCGIVWRDN